MNQQSILNIKRKIFFSYFEENKFLKNHINNLKNYDNEFRVKNNFINEYNTINYNNLFYSLDEIIENDDLYKQIINKLKKENNYFEFIIQNIYKKNKNLN